LGSSIFENKNETTDVEISTKCTLAERKYPTFLMKVQTVTSKENLRSKRRREKKLN